MALVEPDGLKPDEFEDFDGTDLDDDYEEDGQDYLGCGVHGCDDWFSNDPYIGTGEEPDPDDHD